MFDDSNRVVSTFQLLNPQSLLMAILWMSLLIVAFHFIRKRTKLIQNFGILTLVIMVLLMLVRIFVPCNFPFTQNISSTVYGDIEYFLGKLELFYIHKYHIKYKELFQSEKENVC